MLAMVVKEFRQLFRDKRTLGLLVGLPIILLVIFGYAANFDVSRLPTIVVGPQAVEVAAHLHAPFDVTETDPQGTRATVERRLQTGGAVVGIVTGGSPVAALLDGTQLFSVQAAKEAFARMAQADAAGGVTPPAIAPEVLFNPDLKTSWIMIPGLTGLILLFIGPSSRVWGSSASDRREPSSSWR